MKDVFRTPKLWLLVVAAVVLRLLFCFYLFPRYLVKFATVGNQYFFDTYREIAQQILLGNGYRLQPGGMAVLNRPPGYVFMMLFNFPLSEKCAVFVHIQNGIFGGLSCLLTYALAIKLKMGANRALGAAAVVASWPFLIWESKVTVPENLLIVLVPLFFILLASYYEERNHLRRAILCGAIWGWIVLTHGTYQVLLPVIVLALFLARPKKPRQIRWVIFFFIGFMGAVSPWLIRNYLVAGYPVGVATGFGYAYFKGNYNYEVLISGKNYWRDLDQDSDKYVIAKLKEAGIEYPGDSLFRSDPAMNRFLDREALRDIIDRPDVFVIKGIARFGLAWIHQQNGVRTIFNLMMVLPLFAAASIGVLRLRKEQLFIALILFVVTMNFFIASIFPEAIPMRYVLPLLPLLSVFASAGFAKQVPGSPTFCKTP
jgi:4-amino-4-deoxy-L-arabinose transferase-like glycosyltransferase